MNAAMSSTQPILKYISVFSVLSSLQLCSPQRWLRKDIVHKYWLIISSTVLLHDPVLLLAIICFPLQLLYLADVLANSKHDQAAPDLGSFTAVVLGSVAFFEVKVSDVGVLTTSPHSLRHNCNSSVINSKGSIEHTPFLHYFMHFCLDWIVKMERDRNMQ